MRDRKPCVSLREQEALALWVMKLIATHHYGGQPHWTLDQLARHLLIPEVLVNDVLAALEQAGLLKKSADLEPQYLPARPFDVTCVHEVLRAVRTFKDDGLVSGKLGEHDIVAELMQGIDSATSQLLSPRLIKELAVRG